MLNEETIDSILLVQLPDRDSAARLRHLLRGLYGLSATLAARVAALEGNGKAAPSDPVTDASAAMDGWRETSRAWALDKEGMYRAGFEDGIVYARRGKQATPGDLDAEEAKAWKTYGGLDGDADSKVRIAFGFAYRSGWLARGRE